MPPNDDYREITTEEETRASQQIKDKEEKEAFFRKYSLIITQNLRIFSIALPGIVYRLAFRQIGIEFDTPFGGLDLGFFCPRSTRELEEMSNWGRMGYYVEQLRTKTKELKFIDEKNCYLPGVTLGDPISFLEYYQKNAKTAWVRTSTPDETPKEWTKDSYNQ